MVHQPFTILPDSQSAKRCKEWLIAHQPFFSGRSRCRKTIHELRKARAPSRTMSPILSSPSYSLWLKPLSVLPGRPAPCHRRSAGLRCPKTPQGSMLFPLRREGLRPSLLCLSALVCRAAQALAPRALMGLPNSSLTPLQSSIRWRPHRSAHGARNASFSARP